MKRILLFFIPILLCLMHGTSYASIIPIGNENSELYYKIGGGSDFALPPVSESNNISLDSSASLGRGYNCSSINPGLSIANSINNLASSIDNIEKSIIVNATGSLIQLPMYMLAQANPTAYHLFNNGLISAHNELNISTKSCQTVKDQIAHHENPYQDWATIAINDQWKQKLSLMHSDPVHEDLNVAKKELDYASGSAGVPWVNGTADRAGVIHAGGSNQPPVQVISDTVKAGYNTLLNRPLHSNDAAYVNTELARYFPTPASAIHWITSVVGDQTVTTCNDEECKRKQGTVVGHGLLPWLTSCRQDRENCVNSIRDHLGKLVTGNETITKENLEKVSTDSIAISPDVIASIRAMDMTQQSIIVNKLAQEIAIQRLINRALMAKEILSTGAQVPVISANHPAQVVIGQAITHLDNDIRSLVFEGQVRKQMMSDTLSQVLSYSNRQQRSAAQISPVSSSSPLIENSAVVKIKEGAR